MAVLFIVPLLFLASMVFQGLEPPAPDTGAARPYGIWGKAQVEQTGRVPVWFPHIFSGMPSYGSFIFTPRSPFNPIAAVQKLVGENRGAYYLSLLFLAGVGLFAFLRRQGFSRTASTTAALLFSMTPYFPGLMAAGHSTKLEALCLLPFLLLAIDLMLDRATILRSAFLAGVGALLAWSNHPQIVFYGLLIGTLYAAGVLAFEKGRGLGRSGWARLLLLVVLAAALSAAMAAEPFWAVKEYTPYSIRGGASTVGGSASGDTGVGWDYATGWSFHPKELITFLFPAWYGLEGATYWGPMPFTQSTHYFGVVALGLALFGLFRGSGRRRWIWAGVSAVVLLIGFGRYFPVLYGPLYYAAPLFNKFRVPSMVYSILPLCLATLIAGGMDGLQATVERWSSAAGGRVKKGMGDARGKQSGARDGPPPSSAGRKERAAQASTGTRRVLLLLGAILLFWLLVSVVAWASLSGGGALLRPGESSRLDPATAGALQGERLSLLLTSVAQGCILLTLGLLAVWLGGSGRWPRRSLIPWFVLTLGLLAVADVVLVDRKFYHVEPRPAPSQTIPLAGAVSFLGSQPGAFRVFPLGEVFQSNALALGGVESVGGYHPAKLRVYQDLLEENRLMSPGILKMLNVRYVLSGQPVRLGLPPLYSADGYVYPYPDSLPRVWPVAQVESVPEQQAMMRRLEDDTFDPAGVALVYSGQPHPSADRFAAASVSMTEHASGRLRFRVQADGNAFLVVSEIFYPPGWRAEVNGRPTVIYRVNHLLQGIEVPAGSSDVQFLAVSPGRETGLRISRAAAALTLALALGAALWGRLRGGRKTDLSD